MEPLFLGIDLGTSAVKALVVDRSGRNVALAACPCQVHQPEPSWQEQDPAEVWESMVSAVRSLGRQVELKAVKALCFSSAMHGLLGVDHDSNPLFRMLTWADSRAGCEAEIMAGEQGGDEIYRRTGCPATALYYPARVMWVKRSLPDVFSRVALFCSIKDLFMHRLTGVWTMDLSNASSNGLLSIHELGFDQGVLDVTGAQDMLPRLIEPDRPVGVLPGPAGELGLDPGIPVVPGAGDGGLANLGSGAVDPGQVAATIGTSGAMRKIIPRPWIHPEQKTWCYYLAEKRWYAGGAINSGGIVMRWLRDGLLSDLRDRAMSNERETYQEIIETAMQAPAGSEGLTFLPYLFGERTPYWNPDARGLMFGLAPGHGKAHIARAALEGICMCMAHVFEGLAGSAGEVREIRATGGFTRSEAWVQLLADVLGRPVSIPEATESSARGAAILAMKAAGEIDSISEAGHMTPVKKVFEPDIENTRVYSQRFDLFKELYQRVEDLFKKR